jgi:CHAT domain-containing protein
MKRLEAIRLEAACAPPLELLPEVRLFLKESNNAVPNLPIDAALRGGPIKPKSYNTETDRNIVLEEVFSLNRDLQTASALSKKIKQTDDTEIENKTKLQQELSEISNRIAMKPALHKLLTIADFLNREEALRNNIETEPDRYQQRVELQRLRKDMRREPVLERLFGLREGRPVSNQDLHKIAATRKGKVVFVDWLTITSSIDHIPRLYMLLWRNGDCKEIDLGTDHRVQCAAVKEFFQDKSLYLPDVEPTPLEYMNLDHLAPKTEKPTNKLRPVLNCFKLVKPLFDNPLVEPGDLLVLSPTEGFHNFPLHAIQDEGGKIGPLILQHPVMYVPSLSVLHKCFWGRHAANTGRKTGQNEMAKSLVLGGIESLKPVFQYGVKAVNRIGGILNSPDTTFIGANATLNNFRKNISSSDFIHIQLHTTYGDKKPALRSEHGHLSQHDEEDVTFVNSPLDQAILFNGADSKNELTARQITELQLSNGAHFNLMACASGRQGTYKVDSSIIDEEIITDEVMGLVPAFLFSGAGSVTSTLWPIMDEHGAVFSHFFFRELVGAKEKACKDRSLGHNELPWVDLAELHQKAVLEMRRIYKQPSAWAGFVLSGYWQFQI